MLIHDLVQPPIFAREYAVGDAIVCHVFPRTVFRLGINASGSGSRIAVGKPVSADDWVDGLLIVRLHEVISWSASVLTVSVVGTSMTGSEPGITFASLVPVATAAFNGVIAAPSAPAHQIAPLHGPIEALLYTFLETSTGTEGVVEVALSIDLIGRLR